MFTAALLTVLNARFISKGVSLNGIGDDDEITFAATAGKPNPEGFTVMMPFESVFKIYFHIVALFKKLIVYKGDSRLLPFNNL